MTDGIMQLSLTRIDNGARLLGNMERITQLRQVFLSAMSILSADTEIIKCEAQGCMKIQQVRIPPLEQTLTMTACSNRVFSYVLYSRIILNHSQREFSTVAM